VQEYSQASALRDATAQLGQIKQSVLDEKEQIAQVNQLSTNLSARLMASGANPGQIEQIASSFGPSQGALYAQKVNEEAQVRSQDFQKSQAANDRNFQREMFTRQLPLKEMMAGKAQRKELLTQFKDFRKENDKEIQGYAKLSGLEKQLSDPVLAKSPVTQAQLTRALARAAGEVGVLTEEDVKAFMNNSTKLEAQRRISKELFGTAITSDIEFAKKMLSFTRKTTEERLNAKAGSIAEANAELLGTDKETLRSKFLQNINVPMVGQPQPQQQQAPAAQQQPRVPDASKFFSWE
jgi:hypothetical protein